MDPAGRRGQGSEDDTPQGSAGPQEDGTGACDRDGRRWVATGALAAALPVVALLTALVWGGTTGPTGDHVAAGAIAPPPSSEPLTRAPVTTAEPEPTTQEPSTTEIDVLAEAARARAEQGTTMPPSTLAPTTVPTTSPSTTTTRRPIAAAKAPPGPPRVRGRRAPPSGPGVPPVPNYVQTQQEVKYFECVVFRESSGNPAAVNRSSGAAGLFQFMPTTWDMVARHVGRYDLIGVSAALSPPDLQYWFAHELFIWQGATPWVSDGCPLPPPDPSPSTEPPVSDPPTTEPPVSDPPTTDPPGTDPPGTGPPVTGPDSTTSIAP